MTYKGMERDRTRPRMLDETPTQLVAHLAHPNGWWRDSAQKLLVLRQDKSVVPALRTMARESSNRLARFHALWTLEGLSRPRRRYGPRTIEKFRPAIRVQAIRLSESLYKAGDSSLAADVRSLAKDADPNVALQALLTLHLLKTPDAASVIQTTVQSTKSRGVREIGALLSTAGKGNGNRRFAAFRMTPEQRKLMDRGATIYRELCYSCHGNDGKGAPLAGAPAGITMAPPLSGSSRILGHGDYISNVLLHGLVGPIDGKSYESLMAPMGTNDDEWVASIASYVRNSFDNSASFVTPGDVAKVRAGSAARTFPWTVVELESTLPGFLRYSPDWKVTASHNSEMAGFAINSPGFVRWDSGAKQERGMWFQIEFPEAKSINEIQLDSPPAFGGTEGYPRGYWVQVSRDGRAWTKPVSVGEGTSGTTKITLRPVVTKFIRIRLTESAKDGSTWTIQHTRLFEAVKPPSSESQVPRIGAWR